MEWLARSNASRMVSRRELCADIFLAASWSVLMAMREATSPAAYPPTPSATARIALRSAMAMSPAESSFGVCL